MRFLLAVLPGFGHFHPLVPLARALVDAGHEVIMVTAPAFAPVCRAAGFETIGGGLDWHEGRLVDTLPEIAPVPLPRRGDFLMRRVFLSGSPAALYPDLVRIVQEVRAHALVHGNLEFATMLAAARTGLPVVTVSYGVRWTRWTLKLVAGRAMGALRARFGLPPDPDFADFARDLEISMVPPTWSLGRALLRPGLARQVLGRVLAPDLPLSQRLAGAKALALQRALAFDERLRRTDAQLGGETLFIRSARSSEAAQSALPWREQLPPQPTVYASLGTVFGSQHPEIFALLAKAFHGVPLNLVLSLGGGLEPETLGRQPANVRVERFLTQEMLAALLPTVQLSINHGGFGTVMEAAGHGLPMVLLPLTADQPILAQMCAAEGIAAGLPAPALRLSARGLPIVRPERLTPELIRQAVFKVLEDERYATNARRFRGELAALAEPREAVERIEQVVRQRMGA